MRISGCSLQFGGTTERKFGLKPTLLEGREGIFQVRVNGKSIWDSKSKCTRIPAEGEILPLLREPPNPISGEEIGEMVVFPMFPQG